MVMAVATAQIDTAPPDPGRPRSRRRWLAALGALLIGAVVVGLWWPMTLDIQTPHGTVSWDCGTRVAAKHYTIAQTAQKLGDTRSIPLANGSLSPARLAQIDHAAVGGQCAHDLGVGWEIGAVYLLVAGAILLTAGLTRVRLRWLVVPLLVAVPLVYVGIPLLYSPVFRQFTAWHLPWFHSGAPALG
jgi:hypothetical protein